MKPSVDKRQKKIIKQENNKRRNGSWVGYRPSQIAMKTEYKRKGRRVDKIITEER